MASDIELIDDNVILKCDLLVHEGSPLVMSTRDLFVTWSLSRATLHVSADRGGAQDETDDGRHAPGHGMRIEGVVQADDLLLVGWEMTDPRGLAELLDQLRAVWQAAGQGNRDDEVLDEAELQVELDEQANQGGGGPSKTRLSDHFGDVDASERNRLPTLIEALRNQQPKLVRRESSLVQRLRSIEERLDALERRP
jgi:hypothetical protein